METPEYGASDVFLEVLVATAFALVALALLWPPRFVYWESVAGVVGEQLTQGLVAALAVGLGAWFARTTALARRHVVVGAILAYGLGMGAIEVLLQPDSPVHLLWYGLLLGGLLAGVVAWEGFERYLASDPNG